MSKTYTPEQKQQLVQEIKNKSSRQVEQYLAAKSPELPRPETSRQIQEDKREVKLTVCKELDEKLDQLKSRYSHKNQNPTMAELLELMADELLQKSKQHDEIQKRSGHISVVQFALSIRIQIGRMPILIVGKKRKREGGLPHLTDSRPSST